MSSDRPTYAEVGERNIKDRRERDEIDGLLAQGQEYQRTGNPLVFVNHPRYTITEVPMETP